MSAFARLGDEPTEGEDAAGICDRHAALARGVSAGLDGTGTDEFHRSRPRGVFASRAPLNLPTLVREAPMVQRRC